MWGRLHERTLVIVRAASRDNSRGGVTLKLRSIAMSFAIATTALAVGIAPASANTRRIHDIQNTANWVETNHGGAQNDGVMATDAHYDNGSECVGNMNVAATSSCTP
jgi:hypothetical protein